MGSHGPTGRRRTVTSDPHSTDPMPKLNALPPANLLPGSATEDIDLDQQIFGPDQRDGKWYFYAYVDGQQVEWGPYRSREFAIGAASAIERRLNGLPAVKASWKQSPAEEK